ncbi:MAG: hypothetical protein DRI36_01870, partial [Caldiserica bacterium]
SEAGTIEELIVSNLDYNLTYWFAIKAYDEAGNYSVMSNTSSCMPGQPGARAALAVYEMNGEATPYTRVWTGSSWGAETAGLNTGSASVLKWMVLRSCNIKRDEKILGVIDENGVLYIQRYDGLNDTWSNIATIDIGNTTIDEYRCFDIAYEQISGRCLVAYSKYGTGYEIEYKVWSSTAGDWVQSGTVDLYTTGEVYWVRLEPRPGSDDIMMTTLDANNDIHSILWKDGTWQQARINTSEASVNAQQCFDVSWETLSGKCIVMWGEATATNYEIFYSTSNSWDGPFSGPNPAATVYWLELASDSSSDRLSFISLDASYDVWVGIWDGSWTAEEKNTDSPEYLYHVIDTAWEKDSGKCMFIPSYVEVTAGAPGDRGDYMYWTTWDPVNGFSALNQDSNKWNDTGGTGIYGFRLISDPNVNKMMVVGINGNNEIKTKNWTGSEWEAVITVLNSLASSSYSYECYAIAPDRHDNILPELVDNQEGDDTWRNTSGYYDVDFSDTGGSKLSKFQIQVYDSPTKDNLILDWSDVITGINQDDYTTNWQITTSQFNTLQQGYNYVWVRVFDGAGNITESSDYCFYIKKDTGIPTIGDNQLGDDNWYKDDPGSIFDVDFSDSLSLLDNAQYCAYSSTGMTGTQILDWQNIFDNLNSANYTSDWGVNFSSLSTGINYISVRVFDNAGNYKLLKDVFYVKKDTVPPIVDDLQEGDTIWQRTSGKTYNVDFYDAHSLLKSGQYCVSSSTELTGDILTWTYIEGFINISTDSFTSNWSVDFTALKESVTNYISVRCFDVAGNTTTLLNVFYVLKDTTTPQIIDNQEGDDTWRYTGGTTYDVDFKDTRSKLKDAYYKVYKGTWTGSEVVIDWTLIFSDLNKEEYTTDWEVNFDSLTAGYNYVWVKAVDYAGNEIVSDSYVFYVKKSTALPEIIDNQIGDYIWRRENVATYDVDFKSGGEAELDYFETKVTTGPEQTGILVDDWRVVQSSLNVTYYGINWQIRNETWKLLKPGTNYVSVRIFDQAGLSSEKVDVFFILKDTIPPNIINNVGGDDEWQTSPGKLYDVDFEDNLSKLDTAQYRAKSSTGGVIIDWTDIFTSTNVPSYTDDWSINFELLKSGTNYIDIRCWDIAGSTKILIDAFYIKKDTTPPFVIDNQDGDDIWRNSDPGAIYNVDFKDNDSLLDRAEYIVYSSTDMQGSLIIDWTVIFDNLKQDEYTDDWSVNFSSLTQGYNYVSVRVFDFAGHISTYTDVFYIKKDTSCPLIENNVLGDDTWRSSGINYDVNFYDTGSLLYDAQYKVTTSTNQGGEILIDWTPIFTNLNSSSYTTDWSVNFNSLKEGINYLSVKVRDNAFNESILTDAFYIKKDTTIPVVFDNQEGDDIWRNTSGTTYDVDFKDAESGGGLDYAQYRVLTSTGGIIIDWTDITGVSGYNFTTDWQINFALCQEGTNYVYVRAVDLAGNTTNFGFVFYMKKDTVLPQITNNEAGGDNTWRNSPRSYDVDFYDGTSKLKDAYYKVTTSTGGLLIDWTYIFSNLNDTDYTTDWSVDWDSLKEGCNYVSVRVIDYAGNVYEESDIFFIKKDTTPPVIYDNQDGDDTWRSSNSGIYNVDFSDLGGSLLDKFQIKVTTGPNFTGILISDWTDVIINISSDTYTTDWQIPDTVFDNMMPGKNYVSVRVFDVAGSSSVKVDCFYVLKDTTLPKIILNFTGDDTWRKEGGTEYDVDFEDYESSLSTAYYRIKSSTGGILKDWTVIFSSPGITNYTDDWTVDFNSLIEGINYVDVKVYDNIGNYNVEYELFYIKKDTTLPSVINNEAGGDSTWRRIGRSYDVDFSDYSSKLKGAEYRVTSSTGGVLISWMQIFSSTGTDFYTADWSVDFSSLLEITTNYVSIRVFDIAGNTRTVTDAFYILKDTTPPSFVNNEDGGDLTWRKEGRSYDVDFFDYSSGLNGAEYRAISDGVEVISWSNISGVVGKEFTTDWDVDFNSLKDGATNYISIRVFDVAGNTTTIPNAFFIKKDTTLPVITNYEEGGENIWRKTPRSYNVDFSDYESGLSGAVWKAYYNNNFISSGEISGVSGNEFTTDWNVDFDSLIDEATNYITIEVYDVATNTNTLENAFKILKDTSPPRILNYESIGDDIWRNSGTSYDIDFQDLGSGLVSAQYKVHKGTDETGDLLIPWTYIFQNLNQSSYTTDWQVLFSSLTEGYNYVSIRCWDNLNSTRTVIDAFYIKKDTTLPVITVNQNTYGPYSADPGNVIDVDFSDYTSKLDYAQYIIYDSTGMQGTLIKDWTNIFTSTNVSNYDADWSVDFGALLQTPATNYVSVRVFDFAGNVKVSTDAFKIFKTTPTPVVIDNQTGDDTWRRTAGTTYDIDFEAAGGETLDYFMTKICSEPNEQGELYQDWKIEVSNINSSSYTVNWEIDFSTCREGVNYVSVWVFDTNGHNALVRDVFYVKKDTTPPVIYDNQDGDNTWRKENSGYYNIDFEDSSSGSGIDYIQYKITSSTGGLIVDWYTFLDNPGYSYTDDWQILNSHFDLLPGGTNYVSVRVFDFAGSSITVLNAFYILKDTVPPRIENFISGEDIWRTSSGTVYNVDFYDSGGSKLNYAQYKVCSLPNMEGDVIIDWTNIFNNLGKESYTTDWEVDYFALNPGTANYVSIRVFDYAGSSDTIIDAFHIWKDSAPPIVIDLQEGDTNWYQADPGEVFNVDFSDSGGSHLDSAYYIMYSSPNMTGTLIKPWTQIFSSLNLDSYTDDWAVDFFTAQEGYNYISVKVYDFAGSSSMVKDVFYLKKDVSDPSIDDYEEGDDTWRSTPRAYNVDFKDLGSGLDYVQYQVWDSPGQSGVLIKDWTTIASNINDNYYTTDWEVDFASLKQGYNYVSVRAYDKLGKVGTFADVFYIKKDTQPPTITDNQLGDDNWYKTDPGAIYDVDFADSLSLFTTAYYTVYLTTYITGSPVLDWTLITSTETSSYTLDWGIDFDSLPCGKNYVFVKARDKAGNEVIKKDYVFYVKKDTETPVISDNQEGDFIWRCSSGTTYDVDFYDDKSLLDYLQYKVVSGTGGLIIDWYTFASGINSASYTDDFSLSTLHFTLLPSSYSYVSVKAVDNLGNTAILENAFYIKKDTITPVVIDNQEGDDNWYSSNPGGIFDVDFKDSLSGVATCWYIIYDSTGMNGTLLKDWTVISENVNENLYTTNWGIDFSACQQGINYISVKVRDNVGLEKIKEDVFYVKKDITLPSIIDNQEGDDNWYSSDPGAIFDVDFTDSGGSLLKRIEYKVHSGTWTGSSLVIDWTVIADTINASSYTDNWGVNFDLLLNDSYNYVWVRAIDNAGNIATSPDYVFY